MFVVLVLIHIFTDPERICDSDDDTRGLGARSSSDQADQAVFFNVFIYLFILLVSVVSFWWFRFVVSGFSTICTYTP